MAKIVQGNPKARVNLIVIDVSDDESIAKAVQQVKDLGIYTLDALVVRILGQKERSG